MGRFASSSPPSRARKCQNCRRLGADEGCVRFDKIPSLQGCARRHRCTHLLPCVGDGVVGRGRGLCWQCGGWFQVWRGLRWWETRMLGPWFSHL